MKTITIKQSSDMGLPHSVRSYIDSCAYEFSETDAWTKIAHIAYRLKRGANLLPFFMEDIERHMEHPAYHDYENTAKQSIASYIELLRIDESDIYTMELSKSNTFPRLFQLLTEEILYRYWEENINDVRTRTLNEWATNYDKQEIFNELLIVCSKRGESRNPVLRIIDKPTRFEFLTSIALKQNFEGLTVCPNYHVDDEGLPTFTASGGLADIECFDTDCNPLVEVTLITARTQATMEMPAITRHLQEAVTKYPDKIVFSILVAPAIHADTKYMAGYSKYQYNVDILTYAIEEFIKDIASNERLVDLLHQ